MRRDMADEGADGALDQALVVALDDTVSIALGDFGNVLENFESTELDPLLREFKYYTPGTGLVLIEEEIDANFEPAFRVELLEIAKVPEPESGLLLLGAIAALAGLSRLLPREGDRAES
ncbi:MAG: hypothetical protein FJX56_07935 [Alphaproteobacteria bacterium]|nr:hypothetical protein [Alphaproteobacteria bacterium]